MVPILEGTLSQNNDAGAGLSLGHGAAAGADAACQMGECGAVGRIFWQLEELPVR